jgi:hypothetical protein
MGTTTVRVTSETREVLRALAADLRTDMQDVVALAVETLRRQLILARTNEAYAATPADERADMDAELASWEGTLADGLER